MIKLDNISVTYDDVIVRPCNISLEDGNLILIKGESGLGKTSLLYRIGCISKDRDFDYDVNGVLIKKENDREKLRRINYGYVLQESSLFEQYDVIGNLQLYASLAGYEYSEDEYRSFLHHVHIHADIHQSIETLSGGERQRLAIACALCKQPDVLILDEITSSLDKENELHIFDILKELAVTKNKCIILASHSKYAMEYCDKVYEIRDKQLICVKDECRQIDVKWKTKEPPLKRGFYKNYLKYFLQKYKKMNILILSVMITGLLLCLIALGMFRGYANASLADFSKLYQPRLLITNEYGTMYINNTITMFQPEKQAMLDELNVPFQEYPVISADAKIKDYAITVVPYFDENELDTKLSKTMAKDGIVLSKEAYDLIQDSIVDEKITLDIQLIENLKEGKKRHQVEETLSIKGVLKENVKTAYIGGDLFVYMPYEQMETLYKGHATSDLFAGKILLFDNYLDVKKVVDELAEQPIGVNKSFCDLPTIISIIQNINLVKMVCIGMMLVIFILMFSVFQMDYLYKRNKEFALLVINGMRRKHLQKLLLLETAYKFIISLTGAIVLSFLLSGIVFLITSNIYISFGDYIVISIVGFFAFVVISWVFSKLYLDRLIPEAVIRE